MPVQSSLVVDTIVSRMTFALACCALLAATGLPATRADETTKTPIKKLILPGESFLVEGHAAFILLPPEGKRQKVQPWILYAPTLAGYPDSHEKWMHEQFLAAGVAVAGIDVGEAYGSPQGRKLFSALYQELTKKRGFAPQPCLLGRSRGGLWVTSWAGENPDKVAGIAGIYPVFDLRTYPGVAKAAPAYRLSPDELQAKLAEHNPIERVGVLAKAKVPALFIHGDEDTVVPLKENSAEFAARYKAAGVGEAVRLIVAKGQGHNFWEGFFRCQELVDFAIARAQAGAKAPVPAAPASRAAAPDERLWVATPLTKEKSFTPGIEGPACDSFGNIYAVCFEKDQTIGKVTPEGKGEVWVALTDKSAGNGIVFDRADRMFVADYGAHNILFIDPATKKVAVFAHEPKMNQPNDLAIAPDETLWASDPDWTKGTGQLWRIGRDGKITRVAENMGTTNGIEVSPDGKTLYVNESVQRNVWAFDIERDGTLANKRLLKQFPDHGFDGMRCDIDGNLYITRYGKGTVAVLSPQGEVLREIDVLGAAPSNLCFGGPDGRTVYVTEVKAQRLVQFRTDKPGLAWRRWEHK